MNRITIDRDTRNVLTWRIPNDPSPKIKSSNGTNKKSNNQKNKIIVNNSSQSTSDIVSTKKDNNDNSNKDNNDYRNIDNNNNNNNDEDTEIQSPISSPTSIKKDIDNDSARIHNRLWKSFFASVTRSVDELYYLCEEEGDEQKVQDAVELFERSVHDFVKLIERIREQRRFSMDQTTAISWEVRKPTVSRSTKCFSPGSPNFQLMSAIKASPQNNNNFTNEKVKQQSKTQSSSENSMNQNSDIQENDKVNANSKLRAAAPVFLPSNKSNDDNENLEIPTNSITELKSTNENGNSITEVAINKIINVRLADSKTDKDDKENNNTNVTRLMKTENQNIQVNNSNFSSIDDWDAETEAEVVLASEKIWAEAEAWIEAEAAVEEAAWEVLGFDDNKVNNNCIDDNETQSKFKSNTTEHVLFNKKAAAGIRDFSEKDGFKDGKENNDANSSINNSNYNSDNENDNDNNVIVIENNDDSNTESKVDRQSTPQYRCKTPLSLSANSNFATPDNFCDDNSSKSPSQQNINLTPTSRSLHDKLSSPCRRRSLTPVEAKMKAEARQLAAEAHRGGIVQERIEKAKLTWTRIKMRGEKEAQRLAQLEHALEEKLKEAEKRHEEYIKFIKGKAGNENAKVSEVMFINSLNSDMVAEHLQQKFEEVEARVLAAAQRRQERLDAINNQKMRKNSRKTVQMSELRLRLEHIKMERWNNLQKRLETVNQRRLSRLAEMKRRSDEESSKPTIMSPPTTEKVADNIQITIDEKDTTISTKITTIFEDPEGKFTDEDEKRHVQEPLTEMQSDSMPIKGKATNPTKNINSTNERVLLWNFWKEWSSQIKKKGTANSRNAAILKKWNDVCEMLRSRQEVKSKSVVSSLVTDMLNDSVVWLDSLSNVATNANSNKKKIIKSSNFIAQNIEKFDNIISGIYKSKNVKDSIHDFVNANGLLLLRVFLGTEMGLLESEENFSSGVKSSLWSNLGRLLNDICGRASERDKILESGLGVLITDYIHCTLLHLLSWRESKFQPIDTDEYFRNVSISEINTEKKKKKKNKKALNNAIVTEVFSIDDSSYINNSKGKSSNSNNNNIDFNKSWPQEFLILPYLLNTAMLLFRHIPNDEIIISDCQNKLVWYFFASGTLNLICNCLVDLQVN